VGHFLATQFLGFSDVDGINLRTIAITALGSLLVLLVYKKIMKLG
jgi:hypothetical protein